jgi:hypothetical protein
MWNDVRVADKDLTALHNGMAGSVMAFSERAWTGGIPATCNLGSLGTLLPPPYSPEMKSFEQFQRKMAIHQHRFLSNELSYWSPIHATKWSIEATGDTIDTQQFEAYGDVLDLDALCTLHGIDTATQITCTLRRTITSDVDTTIYYRVGFEAPSRANRKSDGIAQQGQWPNRGSLVVNGVAIAPPQWKEPGCYRYHYNTWAKPEEELPYTNEQLYWMREPIAVTLHRGNNTVMMTVCRHFKGQHFQISLVEVPNYRP